MATTNLLILGSGIREQAWAAKLRLSPQIGNLFVLPGCEGMPSLCQACDIPLGDYVGIARFCKDKDIHCVLISHPALCKADLLKHLRSQQIQVIASDTSTAELDVQGFASSRVAWQKLMRQHGIPIPASHFLDNMDGVIAMAQQASMPLVVKTDTVGKVKMGVCHHLKDVEDYLSTHIKNTGDNAAETIIVESFIQGPLICVPVLIAGKNILTAPYCQMLQSDYHTIGACIPATLDAKMERTLERVILVPWLHAFKEYLREYLNVKDYQGMFSLEVAVTYKGPYLVDVKMGWDGLITALVLRNLSSDVWEFLQAFAGGFSDGEEKDVGGHKKHTAQKKHAAAKDVAPRIAEWNLAAAGFCVPAQNEFKIDQHSVAAGTTAESAVHVFQEKNREAMAEKNTSVVCFVNDGDTVPKAAQQIADYWRERRWLPSDILQEALAQAQTTHKMF
jgi:phosphoribosylamine--glycine ligase